MYHEEMKKSLLNNTESLVRLIKYEDYAHRIKNISSKMANYFSINISTSNILVFLNLIFAVFKLFFSMMIRTYFNAFIIFQISCL